jgi:hypothetical protein
MRRNKHLVALVLLAVISVTGCSKPPATPKPHETPSATSPAQPAPPSAPTNSATDQSIAANVGDPAKFRELMTSLQQAVQKHDASAVAALVSYPMDINPHTKKVLHIRTPEAFVAQYDSIITPHVAEVVAKQKYDKLFVNYQGAMLGDGELWIAGICKDKDCKQSEIKIRTIQNTGGKTANNVEL